MSYNIVEIYVKHQELKSIFDSSHDFFFHVLRAVCEPFVFSVEKCPFNNKLIEFSVVGLPNAFSISQ